MTGKDLIIYILKNNLENEPVFKDGKFIGYITDNEAAVKLNVGVSTVRALVEMGRIEGTYFKTLKDGLYIPGNFESGDKNA